MRRLLLALLPILLPLSAPAQTLLHADGPLPSFEVATIKPGTFFMGSGPLGFSSTMWLPTGIMTIREFIASAYGQPLLIGYTPPRVFGGPSWIDHDHYSTQVKIPDDIFSAWKTMSTEQKQNQFCLMVQSLLTQRFHLKVHFETREAPIYELRVAKGGLKLKPDASADMPRSMGSAAHSGGVKMSVQHATMEEISNFLTTSLDREIVNKTMLDGKYSIDLYIAPDHTSYEGRPINNRTGEQFNPASGAPSIFEAMKDFGLELAPTTGQVEVVIVDSIDRPSQN